MGPRIKTEIVLVAEAMLAAWALLGGTRLTWMAMDSGLDRLTTTCRLPAPRPVPATSMLSAAVQLHEAPPVNVEDDASPGWADELSERRIYILPEIRKGRHVGIRVSRLRSGGPIEQLGFQNGDVVLAINGYHLTSPSKALDAYTKLKHADRFRIEIERNGRKMTLERSLPALSQRTGRGGSGCVFATSAGGASRASTAPSSRTARSSASAPCRLRARGSS